MTTTMNQSTDPTVVKGFVQRVMSFMLDRANFARSLGVTFGGQRDLYAAFGWDCVISLQQMWEMYSRGGIAHRIVHAYPDATWGRPPQLYIPGNQGWGTEWNTLTKTIGLWDAFQRADVLAGIGRFSVILVGTKQGALDTPLTPARAKEITFLQPYGENTVRISEWETDPTNPRFGMPRYYQVNYATYQNLMNSGSNRGTENIVMPALRQYRVHASRVIHIARGGLENKIVGVPRYAPIWNYLTDLLKVVGSSSESYWMTAYRGMHADVDKDLDLDPGDEAALTNEIDEYQHNMRRFIRTRGVKVQSLGTDVADPKGAFDVLITLISGTTGIPKRILLGSEAGQLASSQDKGNWAERVEEYRGIHCQPNMLVPFLQWCNDFGILQTDLTKVAILWPDAYRMSPLERGQTAAQTARTVANLAKGMAPIQLTPDIPGTPAVTDPTTGAEVTPATPGTPGQTGDPLITRDEARKIIGLSTDQQMLVQQPVDSPL